MIERNETWRRVAVFLLLRTPMMSFGELVVGPVTIAERAALRAPVPVPGSNKS